MVIKQNSIAAIPLTAVSTAMGLIARNGRGAALTVKTIGPTAVGSAITTALFAATKLDRYLPDSLSPTNVSNVAGRSTAANNAIKGLFAVIRTGVDAALGSAALGLAGVGGIAPASAAAATAAIGAAVVYGVLWAYQLTFGSEGSLNPSSI